ncbi:MAG: hypothetical protein C4570_02415 [Ammonifex sp.]|nr:MAG: hypothetical protein C4570_02415 [Ammonifex sp.]
MRIIAVKDGVLDNRFLGRTPDINAVREMEKAGVDPSGEGGEYHTVVTSGPIFSSPVRLEKKKPVLRDGYWFLEVSVSLV